MEASNGLKQLVDALYAGPMTVLLLGMGLYFTLRTRGVQIWGLPRGIRALGRDGNLRAMLISTGARVGTGNIAGVSAAIAIGGPGAVLWMWLTALLGGASAFAESVLAVRYRRPEGGGAAYYMRDGLGRPGMAAAFTLALTACFGGAMNGLQACQLQSTLEPYGLPPLAVALGLTALTALCLCRGGAARWSERLVPGMTLGFLLLTAAVVALRWQRIPAVLGSIFRQAFAPGSLTGGLTGGAVAIGIRRGLFTNEAGMGSSTQAAASAQCRHPAEQGMAQVLSVFIDTLLLCTATVLLLLLSDQSPAGHSDVGWVQAAVSRVLGPWAAHLITAAVAVFAFTSILGGYFYTRQALTLFSTRWAHPIAMGLCLLTVFAGSLARTEQAWYLTDLCMAGMTLLNLHALCALRREVLEELRSWREN